MPTKTLIAAAIALGIAALGALVLQPLVGWPWEAGAVGLLIWAAVAAAGIGLYRHETRR